MNKIVSALAALSVAVAASTAARAGELSPYRGQRIDLGAVNGVAYYTVETRGYRVVATLADADSKPVRFEAVLAPGQSMVLSSPAVAGGQPARVEIVRADDKVVVQAQAITN